MTAQHTLMTSALHWARPAGPFLVYLNGHHWHHCWGHCLVCWAVSHTEGPLAPLTLAHPGTVTAAIRNQLTAGCTDGKTETQGGPHQCRAGAWIPAHFIPLGPRAASIITTGKLRPEPTGGPERQPEMKSGCRDGDLRIRDKPFIAVQLLLPLSSHQEVRPEQLVPCPVAKLFCKVGAAVPILTMRKLRFHQLQVRDTR